MIIRSQDKKLIVNMDNIDTLEVVGVNIRYFNGGSETAGRIATYSTEEKAIKVLDMIQNTYERQALFSIVYQDGMMFKLEKENGLLGAKNLISPVFQIPQDSEV